MDCQFCKEHLQTQELLIRHLIEYHDDEEDTNIPCGVSDCINTFKTASSRRSHISRKHKDSIKRPYNITNKESISGEIEQLSVIESDNTTEESAQDSRCDSDTTFIDSTFTENKVASVTEERNIAEINFVLNLRAKNISEPLIKEITQGAANLVSLCVKEFCETAELRLKERGINLTEHMNISNEIDNYSTLFTKVNTKWLQDQYFIKNRHLIVPKKISLDSAFKKGKQPNRDENRSINLSVDTLTYISILDVIKSFMAKPEYKKLLQENKPSNSNVLKSANDGKNIKGNQFFQEHPDALQILLYYDDINLTDTASSRPTKMAMFYFTLANIHLANRSSLRFIYLTLPVETEILGLYPTEKVLEEMVKDLKKLENGIALPDGSTIYGTATSFLGDNLASNDIGGFKKGFTATRCCRTCKITYDVLKTAVREDESLLRTSDEYDEQVKQLNKCNQKKERDDLSREFGLNCDCPFNELQYFHAVRCMPPDIFHDIFEGCILKTLHLLLINFLQGPNKVMSLNTFNSKLIEFDYGYNETKPSTILLQHLKADAKLHETGSQIWSLAVITPFILGPFVDYGDKYWSNYILLLQITSIICGYEISVETVAFLQNEIETYLTEFQSLYNCTLIPKQHFLTHYPRHILNFGPLYNYNTFRMEAKHQYFKDMMRKLRNMKSPSVTMTKQHQLYQLNVMEGFVTTSEIGVVKTMPIHEFPYRNIVPQNTSMITTISWIKKNGVEYKSGKCFVMTEYTNRTPQFSLLSTIIYVAEEPIFVCQTACTNHYNPHFNAYNISLTDDYKLVKIENLHIHAIYHVHTVDSNLFITVKRAVGDIF